MSYSVRRSGSDGEGVKADENAAARLGAVDLSTEVGAVGAVALHEIAAREQAEAHAPASRVGQHPGKERNVIQDCSPSKFTSERKRPLDKAAALSSSRLCA